MVLIIIDDFRLYRTVCAGPLFFMSGPSAIFGRAPTRRIPPSIREGNGDISRDDVKVDNDRDAPKSKSEMKVRLVQHEIAEKEACKMIQSLCQELSCLSHVDIGGTNYDDIVDLLSGILLLGNLCKRIACVKIEIEKCLFDLRADFDRLEQSKTAAVEQLECVILRLQGENLKATDMVTELNTKHNHKVTLMQKEMFTMRETINELKTENEKLSTKLQYQERKVMEIPRLEEQYLRTARSIVRQQEVANTMNKIEFKKVEEEVKNMNFFKNKSKFLEENMEKLKGEIEALTNQNRLAHSRYQALLLDFNKLKANKHNEEKRLKAVITSASSNKILSNGAVQNNPGSSGKFRPASAPSVRGTSASLHDSLKKGTGEENNIVAESSTHNFGAMKNNQTNGASFRRSKEEAQRARSSMATTYKSTEDLLNEEIIKLHAEIQKKDTQILRMTKKLSLARAYPLLATQESDDYDMFLREDSKSRATDSVGKGIAWDYDDAALYNIKANKSSINDSVPNIGFLVGNNLHEMNYMLDELESVSTAFRAEEEALQEARNQKAIDLQLEFNDRFSQHRQNLPPHIAAIRKSKSFVKVLNDENII